MSTRKKSWGYGDEGAAYSVEPGQVWEIDAFAWLALTPKPTENRFSRTSRATRFEPSLSRWKSRR